MASVLQRLSGLQVVVILLLELLALGQPYDGASLLPDVMPVLQSLFQEPRDPAFGVDCTATNASCRPSTMAPRLISTLAGVLTRPGVLGDGGGAPDASLNSPTALAIDPLARKLYLADTANHAVRMVDYASLRITTVAGVLGSFGREGQGAIASKELQNPRGLFLDQLRQQLYISDTENHVVRRLDIATGLTTIVAGVFGVGGRAGDGGDAASALLYMPQGLGFDASAPCLYIADTNNHAVRALNLATNEMTTVAGVLGSGGLSLDGGLAGRSLLSYPAHVEVDQALRRLYVSEPYNHAIRIVDLQSGLLLTLVGVLGVPGWQGDGGMAASALLNFPCGTALDVASRQLYVADTKNHAVRLVNLATGVIKTVVGTLGQFGVNGEGGPAGAAQLHFPTGVVVDSAARELWIADNLNHAIRIVDLASYALSTLTGVLGQPGLSQDGPSAGAVLHAPRAVALLDQATLFVTDTNNNAVRRIDLVSGQLSTVAGVLGSPSCMMTGGVPVAQNTLTYPSALAVDPYAQVLYIAETGGHVIRALNISNNELALVAGQPCQSGLSGDGGPALMAFLDSPVSLAVDPVAQLLYIADAGNHVVRAVDLSAGNISTVAGTPGLPGIISTGPGSNLSAHGVQLRSPSGLAVDSAGRQLYIADSGNHVVLALDLLTGHISILMGMPGQPGSVGDGGPAHAAQLNFPSSLSLDPVTRRLYVADTWNHAIRMVDLSTGLVRTPIGVLGTFGVRGDIGRADWAQLHFPYGLAVSSGSTEIYVADTHNQAVRQVLLVNDVRTLNFF